MGATGKPAHARRVSFVMRINAGMHRHLHVFLLQTRCSSFSLKLFMSEQFVMACSKYQQREDES